MSAKQKTYSIHHVLILFAIAWPLIYTYIKYQGRDGEEDLTYNKPNLIGIVISDEKPVFSKESWFDGSYQLATEDYNNDH